MKADEIGPAVLISLSGLSGRSPQIPFQTWATTRVSALAPFADDDRAVKRKTSNKVLQHM
jgi:hypothetical protein